MEGVSRPQRGGSCSCLIGSEEGEPLALRAAGGQLRREQEHAVQPGKGIDARLRAPLAQTGEIS